MTRNESNADRIIRAGVAVAAGVGAVVVGATSVPGVALLVVAAVMLVTSATGFCPLYAVLGISTRRTTSRSSDRVDAAG